MQRPKNHAQHKGQVHAAVRDFLQQAKACGVVVKARQGNQEPFDDLRGRRQGGPKAHFGIKLFFEFL